MWAHKLLFIFDRVMEHSFFHPAAGGRRCCQLCYYYRIFAFFHQLLFIHTNTQSDSLIFCGSGRLWPLTLVYHWVHRLVIQPKWTCAVAGWCDYSTDFFFSVASRKPPQQHVLLLFTWAADDLGKHCQRWFKRQQIWILQQRRNVICETETQ